MSTHRPNLWRVLSETSRVISSHPRHFAALSLLFLLPISISSIIYSLLLQPISLFHSHYDYYQPSLFPIEKSQVLLPILYALFVLPFSLCAYTSITFTTYRGFYGEPISFISSLESILVSFFPLLATILVTQIILGLIVFAFLVLMLLAYNGLMLFGFKMDYDSNCFLVFVILMAAVIFGLSVYLQVQWCLSTAVVVVESEWGFAPLKRSAYLAKGMRGVVFGMMVLFSIIVGILSVWYSSLVANIINGGWSNIGWGVVVQMVVYAGIMTILPLYKVAATTVVFMYCKALHGESAVAFQIDEEMGRGYVQLPFDDGVASYVKYR